MTLIKQRYSARLCTNEIAEAFRFKKSTAVSDEVTELYSVNDELILFENSMYDPSRFKLNTNVNVV